jgi:putative ABC transport system permease protein
MFWYHFKLSIVRLLKNKVFSLINLLGLSIGITSFFVLFIHIQNEKTYDRYIKDSDQIYRVISVPESIDDSWARSLGFIKEAVVQMPEVESLTQFSHAKEQTIRINQQKISQKDVFSVDYNFMELFEVKCLSGNRSDIEKPNVAFISELFAHTHFKDQNPIGKFFEVEKLKGEKNGGKYEIVGIIKQTPIKTHFNCEILLSQKGSLGKRYASLASRKIQWVYHYLKLKKGTSPKLIADKLLTAYNKSSLKQARGPEDYKFSLETLTDIHLKSNRKFELKESNSKINIKLFTLISFVILFVSLVNFMSLMTINLFKRSKEFGLKSSLGAHKKHLLLQVMIEVMLLCSLSIATSLFLIELIKPTISQFYDIQFDLFYNEPIIYELILLILFVSGLIAVLFVRFILLRNTSTSKTIKRGRPLAGKRLLQALMTFQIMIVIILLASTILVNKQINYLLEQPLGFTKSNVLVVTQKDFSKDPYVFARELVKKTQIQSVGFIRQYFGYPTQTIPLGGFGIDGTAEMSFCNIDFLETMNIQLLHDKINRSKDTITGFIVNNHLYKRLMEKHQSLENLNAYRSGIPLEENQNRLDIIGVVEDFNYNSAHQMIGDYVFLVSGGRNIARFTHIRITPGNTREAMACIQEEWKKHYPNQKMDYFFMDDKIEQQYKAENILKRILSSFSLLGVVIGIIGISTLSYFVSNQRTKEIGIRKANGAKSMEIIKMLNGNFLRWLIISFLIACPIAWYFMNKWLQNFAYKTAISWWIFALAGSIVFFIVLLSVSLQSWSAARKNPIESLRYE